MPLKNWSVTAGSNTTAAPNGAPEGMTMASVNDTIRQVMADVRTLAAPTTLAAATTTDIGSKDETIITLTGIAVTITGLGTVSAGIYKFVIYNAAHILTHNATSLILIGGANRTVAAGDASLFVSEGSGNWRELTFSDVSETLTSYFPKSGGILTGLFTQAAGANIASAATVDLTAATGNSPRITGITATSAVTMNAGQWALVVADGAWPLTHHATTNKLNGGASYTCVAGDMVLYNKDLSGIVHGFIIKADGTAVVASTGVLHVRDEKAANTQGGTSFVGNQTRTLNTVVKNTISGASLAANDITLPAGTYRINASAPAYQSARQRIRLFNVTDAAVTLLGTSAYALIASNVVTTSVITGEFTITATKAFRIIHFMEAGAAGGLGLETNDTFAEVYADCFIEKVS